MYRLQKGFKKGTASNMSESYYLASLVAEMEPSAAPRGHLILTKSTNRKIPKPTYIYVCALNKLNILKQNLTEFLHIPLLLLQLSHRHGTLLLYWAFYIIVDDNGRHRHVVKII